MDRNTWHLDVDFDASLFSRNWGAPSHALLLKLFKIIDSTDQSVLSMLPPGVSPAGAAAAASIYFLPGMKSSPNPHCRIALYPGLHFVRQMKAVAFDPQELWRASQKARAQRRGHSRVEGALDKLQRSLKDTDPLLFHWIFRCQRSWTRYGRAESYDLLPRAYFGRNDPYGAVVEFIESEHLDIFSNKSAPYDLLIYCPIFHSRASEQTEDDLNDLVSRVKSFAAHRKLIVARSPFDYWSRRLQEKFGMKGIALPLEDLSPRDNQSRQSDIQFFIVNQFIDLGEALDLFHGIKMAAKGADANRVVINEMKFLLRRLLVSLDPSPREGEEPLAELASRLDGLADSLGFPKDGKAWTIIQSIKTRISNWDGRTKLVKLRELISSEACEIWVTKDLDRQILTDFKQKHKLDVFIRLADRWMPPGLREQSRKVILSRIDREGDLDLTAYLKSGDAVVMSAWEAVVRSSTIMKSWERSEDWRENAKKLKIIEDNNTARYTDPVLDLANYLDTAVENHKSTEASHAIAKVAEDEQTSWWDENDSGSILDTNLERSELVANTGGKRFLCRELHFEGHFGMFVPQEDEIQILEEADGDVLAIPVNDLEPEMTVILFKDAERNSIFDILMDQLERSSEYQADARAVRDWKNRLKEHVLANGIKIPALAAELAKAGREFDQITVRSWIFGSTMAPLQQEHLAMLVRTLGLPQVNPKQLFKSVANLRTIARTLGRALNELILRRDLDQLDNKVRSALIAAGIDLDELSGALEARRLLEMMPRFIEIDGRNIRKIFKFRES
jgi:hypothetical protein